MRSLQITVLGLSITSSWGNGHATTYRSLLKALSRRGHSILFLERNVPWYADHRDLPEPPFARTQLYDNLDELRDLYSDAVSSSDMVIVGSYVPDGIAVGDWVCRTTEGVTAFYDIDTPVTLAKLKQKSCDYLSRELIARYQLYLSFTGGPVLEVLEGEHGSPCARPLYCSVDPEEYFTEPRETIYDLGYLGTYSDDRQEPLDRMMLQAAQQWAEGRFVVAGPQYPEQIRWAKNVQRIEHLPPSQHRRFYNSQRYTLNVTRRDMVQCGYAPSVRLFEAAACGTPIISDPWDGLDEFFRPGQEILISHSASETLKVLREMPETERLRIGQAARARVLQRHTASHRAEELERHFEEVSLSTESAAVAPTRNEMRI